MTALLLNTKHSYIMRVFERMGFAGDESETSISFFKSPMSRSPIWKSAQFITSNFVVLNHCSQGYLETKEYFCNHNIVVVKLCALNSVHIYPY